jgi:hypothetical protein
MLKTAYKFCFEIQLAPLQQGEEGGQERQGVRQIAQIAQGGVVQGGQQQNPS